MDAYKLWVRTNREFVRSLESLANGITWLLPERFSNSEIGPKQGYVLDFFLFLSSFFLGGAVYAVLGIVGTVNQHIIDTAPPPGRGFRWCSAFVREKGKWNFLAVAEGVKALVRLAAFRDSGYRMLLQGGEVVNEEKILDVPEDYGGESGGESYVCTEQFGENAKMALDPMLLNRLRHPFEPPALVVEKPTLSSIWSEKGLSGHLSSMSILLHAASRPHRVGVKFYQLSTSEKDELKRRKLIWALYIMRDPFFTKYTKHHLEKADRYLSPVPLFGFLTAKVVELIVGAQTRYTYTSGS
uniref:Peroxisomal membrane protein PEX16 n=1 Tax=Ananas comosus var. bracteatus TaxID=296719 RepID=A0A6V7QCK2_ANACO|nr:unnamed protein product [Ananas comosus var. bracteatus]